ncbi:MAG: putative bifunctional diguanylate cyclase/phosphodiesterase, partial [Chloroflexota bacterium]
LIDPNDREEWELRRGQIHQGAALELDLRLRRDDGRDIWVTSSCTRLPAANGAFDGAVVMLKDVTERRLAAEALTHQALHDALTGLPNRTLLQDRLQQAVFSARRENRRIAVLLIDLDRFKDVNDAFGHHYGDLLLKEVGDRLQHALRESDTVARLGGDEFAVILTSCLEIEDAKLAAVKILKALDEPFIIEQQNLRVAGSIGVVVHPDHGEDVNTLLRRADVAMYAAKREGDGYSVHGTDQEEASASRLKLSAQLRDGIALGELELYYQPKVSLRTRELKGVEALVRWNHPEQGLVVPDAFIPLAEQTGLIKPLSRWVVETALQQWREWHRRGLELTVAFNLSMRNLHDPHLPDMLEELLQGFHLPPGALQAEITETVLMTNATRTLDVVTRLSNMGVQLSIDDFGTGYSSLAYLKRLPVRELKIDKSFVHDMTASENDLVIVRSTIDLGHSLDLKVTAEGVETPEAWGRLDALGCDLAQGYYMARPLPLAAFESWVAAGIYVPDPRPIAAA